MGISLFAFEERFAFLRHAHMNDAVGAAMKPWERKEIVYCRFSKPYKSFCYRSSDPGDPPLVNMNDLRKDEKEEEGQDQEHEDAEEEEEEGQEQEQEDAEEE